MNADPAFLARGRLHDREAYADTYLGVLFLRAGNGIPYHVTGHRSASPGAFAAIADCESLGLCRPQRVIINNQLVLVAVRTAVPALPTEIAA